MARGVGKEVQSRLLDSVFAHWRLRLAKAVLVGQARLVARFNKENEMRGAWSSRRTET